MTDSGKPQVEVPQGEAPPTELVTEDLVEGTGAEAQAGHDVEVHYVGVAWSTNRQFDASWDRRQTFRFPLGGGRVIAGWDQGVAGMKVGGKRKLTIPPLLAYGEQGSPGRIPPHTTLTYEVDLVQIITDTSKAKDEALTNLKIQDLKEGEGPAAQEGDTLLVHYTGWLADGTKFDSSHDHNQPFTPFKLGAGQVILGWDKGLIGMKVGGKRKLTIPPELAYGEKGSSPTIPPNATLTFEVELLRILK